MKHPVFLLPFLFLATSAWAQEEVSQAAEAPVKNPTQITFSHSVMFKSDALDKFLELYEVYQTNRASGTGTFTDTSVNLDIKSEVENTIDMEQVVLSLNSVLWDNGKWTIWVNGRKYEMDKADGPITLGTAEFFITQVGRENASFVYHPGLQTSNIAQNRYNNREQAATQFKAVKVKGAGVSSDGDKGYAFTLRPNQSFHAEFMVLTEGKKALRNAEPALENADAEGMATDAIPANMIGDVAPPAAPAADAGEQPPLLVFPEREKFN